MEQRLIDANALAEDMAEARYSINISAYVRGCNDVLNHHIKQLSESPSIDPVKHGRWEKQKCQGDYGLCSECNCRIPWIPQNYKYCPSCGCRMDGEE